MSKKKASPPRTNGSRKPRGRIIRIVEIVSESGRRALERVTAEGKIASARQAKHFGITKPFASWTEIEADTWAAASKAFRAGKGKKVSAGK